MYIIQVPYVTLISSYNLSIPSQIQKLYTNVEHLHLVNSYGSYRPIKEISGRPEIIIEGSNTIDRSWKEYEFLYKPGNVNNVLPFVGELFDKYYTIHINMNIN